MKRFHEQNPQDYSDSKIESKGSHLPRGTIRPDSHSNSAACVLHIKGVYTVIFYQYVQLAYSSTLHCSFLIYQETFQTGAMKKEQLGTVDSYNETYFEILCEKRLTIFFSSFPKFLIFRKD